MTNMRKPHAVFAQGPDEFEAVPVIDWQEKGGVHQVLTAIVPTPAGRRPAKELPGFVIVVSEDELDSEHVFRMVREVWSREVA